MAKKKRTTLTPEFWRKEAEFRAELRRAIAILEREREQKRAGQSAG